MPARWRVLALLFFIRTAMAFQFATIGALGPLVGQTFRIDAAGIGFLIGLYLSPGLVFALPGGAIGRAFGDKRAVLAALALMTLGGTVSAFGVTWEMQLLGRALAGVGGVVLNVMMSKMVTDWFEGQEIATAMATFVNSWPAGIALALVVQPFVATASGVSGALGLTAILSVMGFAALLAFYRQPDSTVSSGGQVPRGAALVCAVIAGTIWGLFNGAFAMIFGFAPILLTARGWDLVAAGSATSIAVWLSVISVPIGGIIADRTGRPNLVLVLGLALTALAMFALPRFDNVVVAMVVIGLASGLPVGAIMSLPVRVLAPATRALGMGIFFTMFYGFVVAAPLIAGALVERTGWDGAAIDFGALMLVAAIAMLALFERVANTSK
jgi:MFS family permease